MTPPETQIQPARYVSYAPGFGFNPTAGESEKKDPTDLLLEALPSPVRQSIIEAATEKGKVDPAKKKGLYELYVGISSGQAKIAFCGFEINPFAVIKSNKGEIKILAADAPISALFKYTKAKEINAKNIDSLIEAQKKDSKRVSINFEDDVVKRRISLIKSGSLTYRYHNQADEKAKISKWHYFVKFDNIGGTGISGYVSARKPAGFEEFGEFFQILAKKTGFMKDNLSEDNAVEYLSKYLTKRMETFGEAKALVDADFFKDIALITARKQDIYVSLGLFQRPDEEKPSYRSYYFKPEEFYNVFILAKNEKGETLAKNEDGIVKQPGGKTIDLKKNIKGNVIYVASKELRNDPNIKKIAALGIKVEVREGLKGPVNAAILTNIDDPEDYNLKQADLLLKKLVYKDGEWGDRKPYLSLDELIKIQDSNVGIKIRQAIKKINKRLEEEGTTSFDLKQTELEEMRVRDGWLRTQVFALSHTSGEYQSDEMKALMAGKLQFRVYYEVDRDQNKVINIRVSVIKNGQEMTDPPKSVVEFIKQLFARKGIPAGLLGAPGQVNEYFINLLSNPTAADGDVISGNLKKREASGSKETEEAVKLQMAGVEIDRTLAHQRNSGLLTQLMAGLILKKEKDDGTKEFNTYAEIQEYLDALSGIYSKFKPEELKALQDPESENGKKVLKRVKEFLRKKFVKFNEFQLFYMSDSAQDKLNKTLGKKVNAVLSFFLNGVSKQDFEVAKKVFADNKKFLTEKTDKKEKGIEMLYYSLLKSKHRVLNIGPDLIAYLQNDVVSQSENKQVRLDEAILKLKIFDTALKLSNHDPSKAIGLLLKYFAIKTKNATATNDLARCFATGETSPTFLNNLAWFLETVSNFDPDSKKDLEALNDKSIEGKGSFTLNLNVLRQIYVHSDEKGIKFIPVARGDEKRELPTTADPYSKKHEKTDELYSEGRLVEVIWLDLAGRGRKIPGSRFLPNELLNPGEQKTFVTSYIDADGIETIRKEYGQNRDRFRSDKFNAGNLPYIHVFSEYENEFFKDLALYKDAAGRELIPRSSQWYSIVQKCKWWDGASNPNVQLEPHEIEFVVRKGGIGELEELLGTGGIGEPEKLSRKATLNGRAVTEEEKREILNIVKRLFTQGNIYADMGGLSKDDSTLLENFEKHLRSGDFGVRQITSEILKNAEDGKLPSGIKEEAKKTFTEGCAVLRRLALSAAHSLQVNTEENALKSPGFAKTIEKAVFEPIRNTLRPPKIVSGMGTDIWVLMATKAQLFPEKVAKAKKHLARYAVLSAVFQSAKSGQIQNQGPEGLLTKLEKAKKHETDGRIGTLIAAIKSNDAAKIRSALKNLGVEGECADMLTPGSKFDIKRLLKLRRDMFLALRDYKLAMNYLTNERVDREFLERLSTEFKRAPVSGVRSAFTAKVLGREFFFAAGGNKKIGFEEVGKQIDKFLAENPKFESFTSLSSSPEYGRSGIELKQYLVQLLHLRQPYQFPKGGFTEEAAAGGKGFIGLMKAVGKWGEQSMRMAPAANLGGYFKFLLFMQKGGMDSVESSFVALGMMEKLEDWNKVSKEQLKDIAEAIRKKYSDMQPEGILLSLKHSVILDILKKKAKLDPSPTTPKNLEDLIFGLLKESKFKLKFASVADRNRFEALIKDLDNSTNREEIIKMLDDRRVVINETGLSVNPWDKKYCLLRTDKQNIILKLADKMKDGEKIDLTANGWIREGSTWNGLRSLFGDERKLLMKVFNESFELHFPGPKTAHAEGTEIMGGKSSSALAPVQSRGILGTLWDKAGYVLKLASSPLSEIPEAIRASKKNEPYARKTTFWEGLEHFPLFKLKYGPFMHFSVQYGTLIEMGNHPLKKENDHWYNVLGNVAASASLAIIPLRLFPRLGFVWYADSVDRVRQGDYWGSITEAWAVNAMTMHRRPMVDQAGKVIGYQPSTWDHTLKYLDTPLRGTYRRLFSSEGYKSLSWWENTRLVKSETTSHFLEVGANRLKNSGRLGRFTWGALGWTVGGPFLKLEELGRAHTPRLMKGVDALIEFPGRLTGLTAAAAEKRPTLLRKALKYSVNLVFNPFQAAEHAVKSGAGRLGNLTGIRRSLPAAVGGTVRQFVENWYITGVKQAVSTSTPGPINVDYVLKQTEQGRAVKSRDVEYLFKKFSRNLADLMHKYNIKSFDFTPEGLKKLFTEYQGYRVNPGKFTKPEVAFFEALDKLTSGITERAHKKLELLRSLASKAPSSSAEGAVAAGEGVASVGSKAGAAGKLLGRVAAPLAFLPIGISLYKNWQALTGSNPEKSDQATAQVTYDSTVGLVTGLLSLVGILPGLTVEGTETWLNRQVKKVLPVGTFEEFTRTNTITEWNKKTKKAMKNLDAAIDGLDQQIAALEQKGQTNSLDYTRLKTARENLMKSQAMEMAERELIKEADLAKIEEEIGGIKERLSKVEAELKERGDLNAPDKKPIKKLLINNLVQCKSTLKEKMVLAERMRVALAGNYDDGTKIALESLIRDHKVTALRIESGIAADKKLIDLIRKIVKKYKAEGIAISVSKNAKEGEIKISLTSNLNVAFALHPAVKESGAKDASAPQTASENLARI